MYKFILNDSGADCRVADIAAYWNVSWRGFGQCLDFGLMPSNGGWRPDGRSFIRASPPRTLMHPLLAYMLYVIHVFGSLAPATLAGFPFGLMFAYYGDCFGNYLV